jgi:hypothetical protein
MTVVQAKPNTQPAGVQGAWFKLVYHSDETPGPVNKPPRNNAPKLSIKNIKNILILIILLFAYTCKSLEGRIPRGL